MDVNAIRKGQSIFAMETTKGLMVPAVHRFVCPYVFVESPIFYFSEMSNSYRDIIRAGVSPMENLRWSMRKMDSLTMLLSQNGSAARPQKSCGSLAPSTEVRKHCLLSHCCNAIFFHLIQRWICLPPLQSARLWNLWGDGTVLPKWAFGL